MPTAAFLTSRRAWPAAVVLVLALSATARGQYPTYELMRFGFGSDSLVEANQRGIVPSYTAFWIGSWNTNAGWTYLDQQLREARRRNLTPMINWWYWGDDISPQCVETGCNDARQRVWKDKATWYRMSREISEHIASIMGSAEAVVVVETEFNKNGIETYEPFDGYMADIATIFHSRGNVKVVVGFGNWGRQHWARFDRAVAASDYLGSQLLRSSIRNAPNYQTAISDLIEGARYGYNLFRKQPFTVDLALSSYPAPEYEIRQAALIRELFDRLPELATTGMRAIVYRSLVDNPDFDTSNYHGEAERHWGLVRADGSEKPAFAEWAAGVRSTGPTNLTAIIDGATVTLKWTPAVSDRIPLIGYVLDAGTASGLADIASMPTGSTTTQLTFTNVPRGTYYVRVRIATTAGVSVASNEVEIAIGRAIPGPTALTSSVTGQTVSLGWRPPSTGTVASYVVEAGSAAGLSDLARINTGTTQTSLVVSVVRPGRYYVRVRAVTAAGISDPSNEVTVTVGSAS